MRKIASSGNTERSVRLSARAEARSWPNGFSTTTRASSAQPACCSPLTTVPNRLGGIAR